MPVEFGELLRRVRTGDQEAAAELVRLYEPVIRRVARYRLQESPMGGMLESMDICQSVMASFFVRAATGQFELDTPDQLKKLLVTMARRKLTFHQRSQLAQRRDNRRMTGAAPEDCVAAPIADPGRNVAAKELLDQVFARLSEQERQILDLRNSGLDWNEIAAQVDGKPDALRKQLTRAIDRAAHDMGLDDYSHE